MNRFLAALACLLWLGASAQLHSQVFINTGTSVAPPTVNVTGYQVSPAGEIEAVDPADYQLTVNGQPTSFTASQEPDNEPNPISVLVMADASSATGRATPPIISWFQSAATTVESLLTTPGDEIGLGTFDDRPTLLFAMSSNRTEFSDAVGEIAPGSGSDLQEGLFDPSMGGLTHVQTSLQGRTLLLLLDGATEFDVDRAINIAQTVNVRVYIASVSFLPQELKDLAERSGGAWADDLRGQGLIEAAAVAFISHAKGIPASVLNFDSPDLCIEQQTAIIQGQSPQVNRTVAFQFAIEDVPSLSWSDSGLEFGTSGEAAVQSTTLTASGPSPVTINGTTVSGVGFTLVTPIEPGTVLQPGQSIPIRVSYEGGNPGTFGQLAVESDGCGGAPLYLRAGALATGDVLAVTSPTADDALQAGLETEIRWTNTLPSDPVRIDQSTDGGSTWSTIVEAATGLSYTWRPGPNTTTQGKIRVQRTALDSASIVQMEGHLGPVYSVSFSREDRFLFTGGHDGTVRMWDASTGDQVRQIGVHEDWVRSVDVHPTNQTVVSGSFDATVRAWDYETGIRVGRYAAPSRVWSVAFDPTGSRIAVGSENEVAIISYPEFQELGSVRSEGRVNSVRFSPDGSDVITAEGDNGYRRSASDLSSLLATYSGHFGEVYTAVPSDDGQYVATGAADFKVVLHNAADGSVIAESTPGTASIQELSFSPDGTTLASSGAEGAVKTWTLPTLQLQSTIPAHSGVVYGLSYDGSGDKIASSATDDLARVWTIRNASLLEAVSSGNYSIVSGETRAIEWNMGEVELGRGLDSLTPLVSILSGNDSATVLDVRIVSGDINDFNLEYRPLPSRIGPGTSWLTYASFIPTAEGERSVTVAVETGTGVRTSTLSGTGVIGPLFMEGARPTALSNIVDFGRRVAGQSPVDSAISIRNSSGSPVTVSRVVIAGSGGSAYQIVDGGGQFTLPDGQSRTIRVRFDPFQVGRFASRLELTLGDGEIFAIRLYGEGTGDARVSSSRESLLFVTDQCESLPVEEQFTVRNDGTSDLVIATAQFTGLDAGEFQLVSPTQLPIVIGALDSATFNVRFVPARPSRENKDASIVLTSNGVGANNGRIELPLLARQDTVAFELSVNDMFFDNVNEQQTSTQTTSILNTGTVALRWPAEPVDLGDFLIQRIEPSLTSPGEQSAVTVLFKGGTVGEEYTASYTFTDSTCGRSQTLNIRATVKSYVGFTFDIDTISAAIGTTVEVPIRITDKVNYDRVEVSSVRAQFSVNGTILTPSSSVENSVFGEDGMRTFEVVLPLPSDNDVSTILRFETTWGNDTSSVIQIDSIWTTDTVVIRTPPGEILLADLCREGGTPRLYRRDLSAPTGLAVQVAPHPVVGTSTVLLKVIERGPTTVVLVDMNGKVVQELVQRELLPGDYVIPLPADGLDPGSYSIVAESRTQRSSFKLTVVR